MDTRRRILSLAMIGLGIAGLLFSRHHVGTGEAFLRAYGANITFSFAAFFLIALFGKTWSALRRDGVVALVAFLGVGGQEMAQLVGLYPGVYDPRDLLFDALGVAAGWGISAVARRWCAAP